MDWSACAQLNMNVILNPHLKSNVITMYDVKLDGKMYKQKYHVTCFTFNSLFVCSMHAYKIP